MLILSEFRDYYDSAIVYGIDKTIIYNRTTETKPYNMDRDKINPKTNNSHWDKIGDFSAIRTVVIGFCGQMHPAYIFEKINYMKHQNEIEVFFDKDQVIQHLKDNNLYIKNKYSFRFWSRATESSYIEEFFNPDSWKHLASYFIDLKQPVFVLQEARVRGYHIELEVAPNLGELKFGKVKPAPQCFQEIQNYISGVIGVGEQETVKISNEMRAAKKGYDKWSFRTHKEESKKPRGRKNGKN